MTVTDATTEFFAELNRRGHEALLEKVTGTMRFDLSHDTGIDHFFVSVGRGDVVVSDEDSQADCAVRLERTLFDGIVNGEANAMAAVLRGALVFEGDPELLLSFQRLFPGPLSSRAGVDARSSSTGRRTS
jgi:putative sterol carrier protein